MCLQCLESCVTAVNRMVGGLGEVRAGRGEGWSVTRRGWEKGRPGEGERGK